MRRLSNVEIVVEDEPPDGQPLLGLYRGVPLPRRSSTYSGVLRHFDVGARYYRWAGNSPK